MRGRPHPARHRGARGGDRAQALRPAGRGGERGGRAHHLRADREARPSGLRPRDRDQPEDHGARVPGGDRGAGRRPRAASSTSRRSRTSSRRVRWRSTRPPRPRSRGSPGAWRWSWPTGRSGSTRWRRAWSRTGDNVAAAGQDAAYVEMEDITDGRPVARGERSRRADRRRSSRSRRAGGDLMELGGRVALVTGAGRRLGRALARALAGRGMTLAIHYNSSGRARRRCATRSSRRAAGPPASPPTSPTPHGRAELPRRVAAELGAARRAGQLGRGHDAPARFEETTPEQWDDDPRSQSALGLLLHPGRRARAPGRQGQGRQHGRPGRARALARVRGALGQQGRRRHAHQGAGAARSRPR